MSYNQRDFLTKELKNMADSSLEKKAPIQWLPAGLISWYAAEGFPVALVTSWIALVGGEGPRLRTAWHGRHDALSSNWLGGDFILNVPHERCLVEIRKSISKGQLCLKVDEELGLNCSSGVAAMAPRLIDCAVQIE
jgi:hypothetical protein